ncbi:MAG TPA: protein phosphatase 2C domain-containing protein [Aliidongia sp.]|uniref:PP2C family protein-serine/threonine phosphatase n=1 Tax=Aliidongia sp. TaxID=1914230 RepID=UPI002DDCC48A|nr:protein phosphatase 2C domain-containing protein [Aliidongia sp.]HEV2674190.1 protein phosphatase 2C domain-containing protein [Aliidongia sp.]
MTDFAVASAAATDTGTVRKQNEDAFLDRPDIGLWVVADGMGGHDDGQLASNAIVQALGSMAEPADGASFIGEVRSRLAEVNEQLVATAAARDGHAVIGSTVVALMTFGRFFACLWAGDSRLYQFRHGRLTQVTRDHSQVQEMVDAGLLAPDQAEHHPLGNVITRAVGVGPVLELDKTSDPLEQDDIFLLCSDGLFKAMEDETVSRILAEASFEDVPRTLIDAALAGGSKDNVTVVVIRIGPEKTAVANFG